MVKRVSLKGKGAEIFFGDNLPAQQPVDRATPTALPSAPTDDHPPIPSKQPRLQASKQASVHATTQASKPEHDVPIALGDILPAIFDHVAARATITNTFRYTDGELTRLTDALYDVTKRHRVKLSKQDVARLGLNAVLWDYETRRNESLLAQLALRKKHQPGGES